MAVLCVLSFLSWRSKGERVAERTACPSPASSSWRPLRCSAPWGPLSSGLSHRWPGFGSSPSSSGSSTWHELDHRRLCCFRVQLGRWVPLNWRTTGRLPLLQRVGLPLIAADLAMCAANAVALAGVMKLSRGVPFVGSSLRCSLPLVWPMWDTDSSAFCSSSSGFPPRSAPSAPCWCCPLCSSPAGPSSSTATRTTRTNGHFAHSWPRWRPRTPAPAGTASAWPGCVISSLRPWA